MPVIDRIKDFQNDLVAIRRDIHAHPEIGFEETRTSAIVADLLETWGITVETYSGTGEFVFVNCLGVGIVDEGVCAREVTYQHQGADRRYVDVKLVDRQLVGSG